MNNSFGRLGSALAVAAMLIVPIREAAAGGGSAIHLSGRVPPRASVWLSKIVSTFSFVPKARAESSRMRLTEIDISSNNRQFTVGLQSRNASGRSGPGFIDPATGAFVPYRLLFGGREVKFVDGEARLRQDPGSADAKGGPEELEIDLPPAEAAAGPYEEQLVVVITAR